VLTFTHNCRSGCRVCRVNVHTTHKQLKMSRTMKKKGRRTEKRDKEIEKMRSACIKLRQEVKLAEEMAAEAQAAAGVGPGAAAEASEERRAAKRKSLIKLQAMNPQKHVEASLRRTPYSKRGPRPRADPLACRFLDGTSPLYLDNI